MNWANRLTVARLFLTVIFVVVISTSLRYGHTIGLLLFAVASITDYVDGLIARRYAMVTDFGKLMDPLVDKIMMAAAFICLVPTGAIPPWVAVVIISREFLITGLRLLALSKGQLLAAESLGKHKTTWQIVTVVFFLLLLSLREFVNDDLAAMPRWYQTTWSYGGPALLFIAVMLTLVSGIGYLVQNRAVLEMR